MTRYAAIASLVVFAAAAACGAAPSPRTPSADTTAAPSAPTRAAEREDVRLTAQALPDGSGELAVPAGWRVTAQQAMVDAVGPEGGVSLGLNAQIYDAGTPMAPITSVFGSPARNFQDVMGRFLAVPAGAVQIVEQAPYAGWTAGPASTLHFVMPSQGRTIEGVALVMTQRTGFNAFLYYTSMVSAPREQFAANLPTLIRVWQSWKTSSGVFQARLDDAMQSLAEVGQIVSSARGVRQQSLDRTNAEWDEAVRGVRTYEDRATGERRQLPNDADRAVERMNRAAGYERYRLVPPGK